MGWRGMGFRGMGLACHGLVWHRAGVSSASVAWAGVACGCVACGWRGVSWHGVAWRGMCCCYAMAGVAWAGVAWLCHIPANTQILSFFEEKHGSSSQFFFVGLILVIFFRFVRYFGSFSERGCTPPSPRVNGAQNHPFVRGFGINFHIYLKRQII